MRINFPSEIYTTILNEVNNLIQSLKAETTDDEIRKSQEDAQKQLEGVHREINCALESLQKNAEWDVFSIAFYGETNAGKSTLIETLRILLKESTKLKEREEFKRIIDDIHDIQKQLKQWQNLLERISKIYQPKIIEFDENINIIYIKKTAIGIQIKKLEKNIENFKIQIKVKRELSFTNFLKTFFGKLKEQQKSRILEKKLSDCKSDIATLNKEQSEIEYLKENTQAEWDVKAQDAKVSVEGLQKKIKKISERLTEYSDGKIIGDGHSDFTREVTTYHFEHNGQKFALLDVPGIEGKEELVLNIINDAVQKAHAVFYISGKPTQPQTGDEGSEGTLEKIKKHLGQQTEVYSIFNKRIKNPQQLKPGLIDDDEKISLKELDNVMRNRLGEQYEKHIVLSAYPAFLSIANCWQNDFEKGQKKFLEKFNSQINLLQASLVKSFSDWLTTNLVNNCKAKIKKSNYKKVSVVLARTSDEINKIHKSLQGLYKKLLKNKKTTDNQLDEVAEILKQQLNTEAHKAVNEFKSLLRRNIYNDIDKGLDNDKFKIAFERRKNKAIDNLSIILKQKFESVMTEFKYEIAGIIEKHHRYASELLSAYKNAAQFNFDFTPNLDIKNSINWAGTIISIVGSITGVILCLTNPAGWVVLALSILGVVINIGKMLVGWLNHKYRASQQKKSADNNIEKMGDKAIESVMVNLRDAKKPLQEGIESIKNELHKSINHIKTMNQIFSNVETKFKLLTTIVEEEGTN